MHFLAFSLNPVPLPFPATPWIDRWLQVENLLSPLTGHWGQEGPVSGITWLQLMVAGAIILITAALVELLRHLAKRKARQLAVHSTPVATVPLPPPSWFRLLLEDAHPPLLLAIWVWGLYTALALVVFRLPGHANAALTALEWVKRVGLIIALFWFLVRVLNVVELELKRWSVHAKARWSEVLAEVVVRGLRLVVPLIGVMLIVPTLALPPDLHALFQTLSNLALIGFIGFIFCELAATAERAILTGYRVDVKDNLGMRKIQTQVSILKKVAVGTIVTVTVASMLMLFEPVRSLGKSILASAGVAGIVIGIAAQRTLATLLAGIQIAFTQPIRLDDVVIVESEWGRIEEITLTYVVVAIWDLRRMVLPITYFIEKPFQNWTRVSAELLGSVFLYVDYTVPVDALRKELDRILEGATLWDKKVKALQVTDAKENTLELRILVSAVDSSSTWDLRCLVREKLVDFLQREHPQSLPHRRTIQQIETGEVNSVLSRLSAAQDPNAGPPLEGKTPPQS